MFADEHLAANLLDTGFADEIEESYENRLGDSALGVVEKEVVGGVGGGGVFLGEAGEVGEISCEEVVQDELILLCVVQLLEILLFQAG